MKPTAFACGIPRSASTFVAQVMRATLTGWNVLSTHPAAENFNRTDEPVIASYRDPRDTAASLYRVRLSRGGAADGGWAGLEAEIDQLKRHVEAFVKLDGPNVVKVCYEDFWNNHNVVFDAVERLFHLRFGGLMRATLREKYGLHANRERASRLANFNSFDATGIHGDHIGAVVPGSWREVLPPELHEPMQARVAPLCEMLGYQ